MFYNYHYIYISLTYCQLYPASGFRHMNTKAITMLISYTDLPITS